MCACLQAPELLYGSTVSTTTHGTPVYNNSGACGVLDACVQCARGCVGIIECVYEYFVIVSVLVCTSGKAAISLDGSIKYSYVLSNKSAAPVPRQQGIN